MKQWNAIIFDGEMNVVLDKKENELKKDFDSSSETERWVDNRLVNGGCDWYGVITFLPTGKIEVIDRLDSMARLYKKKRGAFCKRQNKTSTNSLGFGVKVKDDGYKGFKP